MPDAIQTDAIVEKSTEVEYAVKNPRIEKFIKSLENNCWRTAKDLGQSLGGSKYNYVFNDYGIHGVGYSQEIFCRLYFRQLNYMLKKFVGNIFKGYDYKKKFVEKSIEYDNLWKRIVDDAEIKGAVVNSNEYELGLYFYVILYLYCIYELNKDSNKLEDIQSLKLLQGCYEGTINVSFESPDDMQKIIDKIRNNLESGALNLEKAHSIIDSIDSSVSMQEIIDKLDNRYEFDIKEQSLDEQTQIGEPKQPEPVEDIDNKDETLESEDKQIDDDLSSEESKDINTETDNSNIENLSDTDTEETDMNNKEKDSNVRFSAFGIDLTFEVPDFAIVSKTQKLVDEYLNKNQYIPSSDRYAFRNIILLPDQRKRNIVGMLNDENDKEQNYWGRPQELIVCWLMKNSLHGLNPEQTEEDVLNKISDRQWVQELRKKNIGLNNLIFDTKTYKK